MGIGIFLVIGDPDVRLTGGSVELINCKGPLAACSGIAQTAFFKDGLCYGGFQARHEDLLTGHNLAVFFKAVVFPEAVKLTGVLNRFGVLGVNNSAPEFLGVIFVGFLKVQEQSSARWTGCH